MIWPAQPGLSSPWFRLLESLRDALAVDGGPTRLRSGLFSFADRGHPQAVISRQPILNAAVATITPSFVNLVDHSPQGGRSCEAWHHPEIFPNVGSQSGCFTATPREAVARPATAATRSG